MKRHLFFISYELDIEPFKSNPSLAVFNINTKNGLKALHRYDHMQYWFDKSKIRLEDYKKIEKIVAENIEKEYGINLKEFNYSGVNIHCIFDLTSSEKLISAKSCPFFIRYAYALSDGTVDYGKCIFNYQGPTEKEKQVIREKFKSDDEWDIYIFDDVLSKVYKEIMEEIILKTKYLVVLYMYEL